MGVFSRFLGIPWVYDRLRPLVVGGIDRGEFYRLADIAAGDVVLDIGCGTGDALDHLPSGVRYYGFDTDATAIEAARRREEASPRGAVLEARPVTAEDLSRIAPTVAILGGLLHHLDDDAALGLLGMLADAHSLRTVIALDVTYIPGQPFNNLMTRLDRGRFARSGDSYVRLAEKAGWGIEWAGIMAAAPDNTRVSYWAMQLERLV